MQLFRTNKDIYKFYNFFLIRLDYYFFEHTSNFLLGLFWKTHRETTNKLRGVVLAFTFKKDHKPFSSKK